jgi:hypothetical protein
MRYCPNLDCPHARATGGAAEYRDGVTRCTDCGTELIDLDEFERQRAAAASTTGPDSRSSWKTIPHLRDLVGIQLARTILEVEEIPCLLTAAGLMVPEDRFTEATELLSRDHSEEIESLDGFPDEEDEDVLRCPRCTSSGVTRDRGWHCMACNHRW